MEVAIKLLDRLNEDELIYNYLPYNFAEFARILNFEQLEMLLSRYGGDNLYIPTSCNLERYKRDLSIIKDYRNNLSILEIAQKNKVSANTVRNVIRALN